MRKESALIIFISVLAAFVNSCKHDISGPEKAGSGYPDHIEAIILSKCAVAGCHNNISKDAAAGLSLETWEELFKGGSAGAVVIPYRSDFSTLFYYINTDSTLGLALEPTMPVNGTPLSQAEVHAVKSWIDQGAPDKSGFVKFSDDPLRKKVYVANQGCDVVFVLDAASKLIMRGVDVGNSPLTEYPHMIKVSKDNQFWFSCNLGGTSFQKFRTADNALVSEAQVGVGSWNTFDLTDDGSKAYLIDFAGGKIAIIDLVTMNVSFIPGLSFPHGVALNNNEDTLYVTGQLNGIVTKFPVNDLSNNQEIDIEQSIPFTGLLQIHEIAFSPAGSHYYLTCQNSNEVRVLQTSNDSLVAAIPVPEFPQELVFAKNKPYLFVSCMEAMHPDPMKRSYIAVINYQTNTWIKNIYAGFQSHGLALDETNNILFVGNRNQDPNSPAPHHGSVCNGQNGNITAIDLNTLELIPGFKTEVSVDPYGMGISH